MNRLSLKFFIFAIFLYPLNPFSSDTVQQSYDKNGYLLRYNLSKETKFECSYKNEETLTFKMSGNEIITKTDTEIETFFIIKSITESGNIEFEAEYKNFKITNESPFNNNITPDFSAILNKNIGFTMSPLGELSNFSGFDELPEIKTGENEKLNREKYKSDFKYLFPVFPEKKVRIGESWNTNLNEKINENKNITTVLLNTKYTLAENIEKGGFECLKIDADYKIKVNGKGESGGNNFSIETEGNGKGEIYFAYKLGVIISIENMIHSKGYFSFPTYKLPIVSESITLIKTEIISY